MVRLQNLKCWSHFRGGSVDYWDIVRVIAMEAQEKCHDPLAQSYLPLII